MYTTRQKQTKGENKRNNAKTGVGRDGTFVTFFLDMIFHILSVAFQMRISFSHGNVHILALLCQF